MMHDASGPTWRQTCFVPAAGPQLDDEDLGVAVLGRFASKGSFRHQNTTPCPALHIVHDGVGTVRSGDQVFEAGPGSVFCFAPGVPVVYADHPGRPWRYTWINFAGKRAHELTSRLGGSAGPWMRADLPVAQVAGLLDEIEAAYRSEEYSWFYPSVAGWRVLDALCPRLSGTDRAKQVATAVRSILDAHFTAPLKLGALAKRLNVDRSTVFRQFHRLYGCTPKHYLDRLRLDHAAALLRDSDLSIADTAGRCGYASAQRFAKAFAARFGAAPRRWRASPAVESG